MLAAATGIAVDRSFRPSTLRRVNPSRFLAFGAWFVVAALPATAQIVWNPTTDFSTTNGNPNGVWIYGWMDTGFAAFTPYTNHGTNNWYGWGGDQTPTVWLNANGSTAYGVPLGYLAIHPGSGDEPSVLRWTAPATFFNLAVTGQFLAGDIGTMQVTVFQNATTNTLFSATDAGSFSFNVNVNAGDTLNFAVFGGYFYGNTPLQVSLTSVPEPSVLALLGIGLAASVRARRSHRRPTA